MLAPGYFRTVLCLALKLGRQTHCKIANRAFLPLQEVPRLQTTVTRMVPVGRFLDLHCSCALLHAFALGPYQRQNNVLGESLV